jgi:MtN3 and saliva related transmembrane protein
MAVKVLLHTTRKVCSLAGFNVLGFVVGFGTTFAAVPDLIAMFGRRSSAGMNPRMAVIIGGQVLWVYYGLLIGSRAVIAWT